MDLYEKKPYVSELDYSVNTSLNDQFWKIVLNFQRPDIYIIFIYVLKGIFAY